MSQLRAEVANSGSRRGHLTTGIFGADRPGFSFTDLTPPAEVPPPADCPSYRDPPPPGTVGFRDMPFWRRLVETRGVYGHPPWEAYVPDRAERIQWYGFDETPFLDDGTMDPLALVVLADTMPGAVSEKVGPTDRAWFAPSVDLTVHLLDHCRSPWVLAHNRARFAGDGYASADMALWDCGETGSEPAPGARRIRHRRRAGCRCRRLSPGWPPTSAVRPVSHRSATRGTWRHRRSRRHRPSRSASTRSRRG
jgi:hypothetical protein